MYCMNVCVCWQVFKRVDKMVQNLAEMEAQHGHVRATHTPIHA
jgi:hypothetical protein